MMYADYTRDQAISFLSRKRVDTKTRLELKDTETLLRWVKFFQDNALKEAA